MYRYDLKKLRNDFRLFQESPWRTPLATAFVEAGVEMGYENRDCNGEFQVKHLNTKINVINVQF